MSTSIHQATPPAATGAETTGGSVQYLSFSLAGEDYAVDILRVQEIRGMCSITPLPHTPPRVCGVMNLRGAVVPVIDLGAALGFASEALAATKVIIILSVGTRTIGFVVDAVSDVLDVEASAIEYAPDLGGRVDAAMVAGIARAGGRFVVLLEIDLLAGRDLGLPGAP